MFQRYDACKIIWIQYLLQWLRGVKFRTRFRTCWWSPKSAGQALQGTILFLNCLWYNVPSTDCSFTSSSCVMWMLKYNKMETWATKTTFVQPPLMHSVGSNNFFFGDADHLKFAFCFAWTLFHMNIYFHSFFFCNIMHMVIRRYQCILLSFNLTKPEYCSIYHLTTNTMCNHQRRQFLRANGTNYFRGDFKGKTTLTVSSQREKRQTHRLK